MTEYADTSFLWSLYLQDVHSARATASMGRRTQPLLITSLLEFEFQQAVRLAIFRGVLTESLGLPALSDFQRHIADGMLVPTSCNWSVVHATAGRLSSQYTRSSGFRGFDLLHVACALTLGATVMLTFDQPQRRLAAMEGLKCEL